MKKDLNYQPLFKFSSHAVLLFNKISFWVRIREGHSCPELLILGFRSLWLPNQDSGQRPLGLALPGMFINTNQSQSIFIGFQVEEVDLQQNFSASK